MLKVLHATTDVNKEPLLLRLYSSNVIYEAHTEVTFKQLSVGQDGKTNLNPFRNLHGEKHFPLHEIPDHVYSYRNDQILHVNHSKCDRNIL